MIKSILWRKARQDIRAHRGQWLAMMAALVLGGIGMIGAQTAKAVLEREIPASFLLANSPDLTLWFDNATPEVAQRIREKPMVEAAELRGSFTTRIQVTKEKWLPLRVHIVSHPREVSVGRILMPSDSSTSSTASLAIYIERSGRSLLQQRPGETITLRTTTGENVSLALADYVFDPAVAPSTQEQTLYGYCSLECARALHTDARFDQVAVTLRARGSERDAIEAGDEIRAHLNASSASPLRIDSRLAAHPHEGLMNAMLRVIGVFGWMATLLAAALTAYLSHAWMRREAKQIAVMKTLGARRRDIVCFYSVMAVVFLAATLLIAMPLGMMLGLSLVEFQAGMTNIDIQSRAVPMATIVVAALLLSTVLLGAMLMPILTACSKRVVDALHGYSIVAPNALARASARLSLDALSVGNRLALRNVWRRPWRAALVVAAIGLGGGLLLTTRTNFDSYLATIDKNQAAREHDAEVFFSKAPQMETLQRVVTTLPHVQHAEIWQRTKVTVTGSTEMAFTLSAFPDASRMFVMPFSVGRYVNPEANDEIVITRFLADRFPALSLGVAVELVHGVHRQRVTIVGIVEEIAASLAYANASTFVAITGTQTKGASVRIKLDTDDVVGAINALDRAFMRGGIVPAQIISAEVVRESLIEHFLVVGGAMKLIALCVAVLGAIMLCALAVFNTLDRTRELAILRAIGAPPSTAIQLMLIEAASVMAVGFVVAVALSLAISRLLLDAGERMLLHIAVPMQFSWFGLAQLAMGAGLTFAVIALLIVLASRTTATSGLAYE